MRATAAGLLTGALALAAHTAVGAEMHVGPGIALIAVLAATVAGIVATWGPAADARVLAGTMALAQVVGHVLQSLSGHAHGRPAEAMVLAHAVAAAVGAILIAAGDHLRAALSKVIRACAWITAPGPRSAGTRVVARAAESLFATLPILASSSYRGPPAAV